MPIVSRRQATSGKCHAMLHFTRHLDLAVSADGNGLEPMSSDLVFHRRTRHQPTPRSDPTPFSIRYDDGTLPNDTADSITRIQTAHLKIYARPSHAYGSNVISASHCAGGLQGRKRRRLRQLVATAEDADAPHHNLPAEKQPQARTSKPCRRFSCQACLCCPT